MTVRNVYLNGDVELARQKGFDIVQLKLDGWYCTAIHHAAEVEFYSETNRQFATATSAGLDGCILIGEFMRGTQWSQHPDRKGLFFVYDIAAVFGEPITNETYITRYKLLRKLPLPSSYRLVDCYRIEDFDSTWQRYVMCEGWEGVVFRRSSSILGDAIMRQKREYSLDGTVVGFEPGLGKYEGSLGAVRVAVGENVTSVGGGFTDVERRNIWTAQTNYLGRVMEFTCNAIFESGNVRHPRFVRWRDDKSLMP